MDDIIGRGEDRPPRRSRRIGWIAAAVVVVAVLAAEHLPHGSAPRSRHPSAQGSDPAGVGHFRFRVQAPGVLPQNGNLGKVATWAAQVRLPRAGTRPVWFWPATGRVVPIGGLPDNRTGYAFARVGGGWAIRPGSCSDCLGPPAPVFYLPDRAWRVTRVGNGNLAASAAVNGGIWLSVFPTAGDPARMRGTAREYTDAGILLGPAVLLPAGYRITRGASRGLLLLSSDPAGHATYRLWDPATGSVVRTFQEVIAASATEVAYEPPCRPSCTVRVLNLSTGRATVVSLPAADTVMAGRFSPDGRFLALEVSANNDAYGASAMRLEVAAMPNGHVVVVPHTNVSSDALDGFGWPGTRDVLVAEFSFIGQVQAVFWNPRAGRLALADVSPSQDPFGLVVG